MDVDVATQEAMGKMVMAQMQQHTLASIKAAVREDLLEEVKAEAFEQAMAELDDRLQREREKVRDEFARYKDRLDGELEDELIRREDVLRREVKEAYEERLLTLQDDLKATATARDQVMGLLLSLVQQLFSERKRYLADSHVTELDLVGLNDVLAVKGLRVRGEFRHSERQVVCTLKNGVGQRTVFWLERLPAAGVAVEGEGDDDTPLPV